MEIWEDVKLWWYKLGEHLHLIYRLFLVSNFYSLFNFHSCTLKRLTHLKWILIREDRFSAFILPGKAKNFWEMTWRSRGNSANARKKNWDFLGLWILVKKKIKHPLTRLTWFQLKYFFREFKVQFQNISCYV